MRPRLITAENGRPGQREFERRGASMRPRLITAENAPMMPVNMPLKSLQ